MDYTFIIGVVGSTLTTSSLVPQAVKILKTKSASDLSFWAYFVLTLGAFLWVVYGILLKQPPIYVSNNVVFLLSASIVFLKIRHS